MGHGLHPTPQRCRVQRWAQSEGRAMILQREGDRHPERKRDRWTDTETTPRLSSVFDSNAQRNYPQ